MWDLKRRIYDFLPAKLQDLAVSMVGWRIARRRYGGNFRSILAQMVERDGWSDEQILELRQRRLVPFVRDAAMTVPFYKRMFAELGIEPEDIKTEKDVSRLPILLKNDVQRHWEEMHPPDWKKQPLHIIISSGTTGTGMITHETRDAEHERWAVIWRYRLRHGLRLDQWSGLMTGHTVVPTRRKHPPFRRINRPGRMVIYSNYHNSDRNLPCYIEDIAKHGLTWLHGYPTALNLLARSMLDNDLRLPKIKWVTTGAESLLQQHRDNIEKAFGVKATEHYGLAEAAASITQCPAGKLHVDEDYAYTEFIPHPDVAGVHKIIGTNFSNPAFPLIRFDTQDLAILDGGKCDCGLPGRLVADIVGREEDLLITPSGSRFAQPGFYFYGIVGLREAQLVQKSRDSVEFRLVAGKNFSLADEALILERFRNLTGGEMKAEIKYVDKIERTKGGKIRCLVSEIDEEKSPRRDF